MRSASFSSPVTDGMSDSVKTEKTLDAQGQMEINDPLWNQFNGLEREAQGPSYSPYS